MIEAANRFIAEVYLPDHNARFAVAPEEPGSAFVPDRLEAYRDILCLHEDHVVGNDNTVRYHGLALQIPPSPARPHYVRAKVRVHEYPDGHRAVFHRPRCLARYDRGGETLEDAVLHHSDLSGANLEKADLRGADLLKANLTGANLRRAKLQKAILKDANLTGADLTGADLTEGNLERANLTNAKLDGVKLQGVRMAGAIWIDGKTRCKGGSVGKCDR